jgi:hypothetical protein
MLIVRVDGLLVPLDVWIRRLIVITTNLSPLLSVDEA